MWPTVAQDHNNRTREATIGAGVKVEGSEPGRLRCLFVEHGLRLRLGLWPRLWRSLPRLVTSHEHRQAATGTESSDERGSVTDEKARDPRKCGHEHGPILCSRKVSGGQDERRHSCLLERLELGRTMANALVLGDHHPPVSSNRLKPYGIRRIIREVIRMNFDMRAHGLERPRDNMAPQISVNEENGCGPPTRRRGAPSRSGSLPGSRSASGRNPPLDPPLPRRHRSVLRW